MKLSTNSENGTSKVTIDGTLYMPVADEATANEIVKTGDLSKAVKTEYGTYVLTPSQETAFMNASGFDFNVKHAVEVTVVGLKLTMVNHPWTGSPSKPTATVDIQLPAEEMQVNNLALAEITKCATSVKAVSGMIACKLGGF